ncbi:MAG: DUF4175 domain-containing protein [Syntrophomonadaceae bacterium]|nr:DUF4175 domain-containing protein [Syntrophomonadaceae bacterium]
MNKKLSAGRPLLLTTTVFLLFLLTINIIGTGCRPSPQKSPAPGEHTGNNQQQTTPEDLTTLLEDLNTIAQSLVTQVNMADNPPVFIGPLSKAGINQGSTTEGQRQPEKTAQTRRQPEQQSDRTSEEQNNQSNQKEQPSNNNEQSRASDNKSAERTEEFDSQQANRTGPQTGHNQRQANITRQTEATDPGQLWQSLEQTMQDLHQRWNSLEPQIVQAGGGPELITNFESQLTKLTDKITARQAMPTLIAVNEAYRFMPDFFSLFQGNSPPELYRLRYHTNSILLQAKTGSLSAAQADLTKLKEEWNRFRPRLEGIDPIQLSQFEFGLSDLETALQQKNKALVEIESTIVLNNIDNLESQLGKKQTEQKQGQTQGQEEEPGHSQYQNQAQNQGQSSNQMQ